MRHKELFKSPLRTVELINIQANAPENVNFAKKYFPPFKDGAAIWDTVKPLTKFKADPQTVDTIQGISTLFNDRKNIHGISGQGDCDCFVSALASIAIANNLPFKYIIQGNNKPSHIAIKIGGVILDLTNPIPDYLRQYNFTKYINPMYVALADDSEEMAIELNDNSFDFGRRPSLRRAINTAKRFAPPVIVRTVDNQLNRINRIAGITPSTALTVPGVAQMLKRRGQTLPANARAKIFLAKRQLKRRGFGDSEAELLAIQNFSDDFGRGRISLKRGLQNVGKAAKTVGRVAIKAAPILLPVAGKALSFVPGGAKVSGLLQKGLQRVGGAKTLTAGRGILQGIRAARPTAPATLPMVPTAGMIEPPMLLQSTPMATMNIPQSPAFSPDTYVLPSVPITAPKINPLLLLGGGALAIFLLTRKK